MFYVTNTIGTSVCLAHKHHTYVCPFIERGYDVTKNTSIIITTTNCKITNLKVNLYPVLKNPLFSIKHFIISGKSINALYGLLSKY